MKLNQLYIASRKKCHQWDFMYINFQYFVLFSLITAAIYMLPYSSAFAQSALAKVMCDVMAMILLDIGRAVATIAVIGLALSAILGKATLSQLWVILAGIGVTFGAPMIMLTILSTGSLNPITNATEFGVRLVALGAGCGITSMPSF